VIAISFQSDEKFQLVYLKRDWKNGKLEKWVSPSFQLSIIPIF